MHSGLTTKTAKTVCFCWREYKISIKCQNSTNWKKSCIRRARRRYILSDMYLYLYVCMDICPYICPYSFAGRIFAPWTLVNSLPTKFSWRPKFCTAVMRCCWHCLLSLVFSSLVNKYISLVLFLWLTVCVCVWLCWCEFCCKEITCKKFLENYVAATFQLQLLLKTHINVYMYICICADLIIAILCLFRN